MKENRAFQELLQNITKSKIAFFLFLASLLTANFTKNFLNRNDKFSTFQWDSETLVSGCFLAKEQGLNVGKYGLGRYTDLRGDFYGYDLNFITDTACQNGFSRTGCFFTLQKTGISEDLSKNAKAVVFENGEKLAIIKLDEQENWYHFYLDGDKPLFENYGDLNKTKFLDENQKELPTKSLRNYKSQFGLQGKFFQKLNNFGISIRLMHLFCSSCLAIVLTAICFLLQIKFNRLFAAVWYAVFLLSPLIVNFAKNLYWVEFTWFVPLLAGLFLSLKIECKKRRFFCCALAFVSIFVKSLCGYEYMSTIMIAAVMFLLSDFISAIFSRKAEHSKLIFHATFVFSICMMAGFFAAVLLHANLRGDENILQGLKNIAVQDGIRRTVGNKDTEKYLWHGALTLKNTLSPYFHFYGLPLSKINFAAMLLAAFIIFFVQFRQKRLNAALFSLTAISFLAPLSWYVLALQHSYIHLHMNYVLWYFGFVQMCVYVILTNVCKFLFLRCCKSNKIVITDKTHNIVFSVSIEKNSEIEL